MKNFWEDEKMDSQNCYSEYLRRERLQIKKVMEAVLGRQKFILNSITITDDGYVVDAKAAFSYNTEVPFSEICERVDGLEFKDYIIVDITFSRTNVNLVLVPITKDAMNRFIWNYITCYFPFVNEVESLSLAIGVLERMIEPIGGEVQEELDDYIADTVQ